MDTVPNQPLGSRILLISAARVNAPIMMVDPIGFFYIVKYAPELARNIWYGAATDEFFYGAFTRFGPWSPVKFNPPVTYEKFVASHPYFFVHGHDRYWTELAQFSKKAEIRPLRLGEGHFLAGFSLLPPENSKDRITHPAAR